MSSTVDDEVPAVIPKERLELLFDEVAELCGQRNALDGRLVEIVAEIDRDQLWGMTGVRSLAGLVAWKMGAASGTAQTMAAVAQRIEQFPRCVQGLREGRLSLDQVGAIAKGAADGSDAHYAQLASVATVSQLRTAISLEPRPEPQPRPEPTQPTLTKTSSTEQGACYRITLPTLEAARFDAALQAHRDALVGEWKADHGTEDQPDGGLAPPFPTNAAAFVRLVDAGGDAEAARRPHSAQTTVVVHLDVEQRAAALHLGPILTDADRQYLTCDATFEVWFERDGQPIGAGRSTRQINRRLRRALEHRHPTCAVPGCGATRGLHAHHIKHWEDGGETELDNLVLVCPYHHRLHHAGLITIVGPAPEITVLDDEGDPIQPGSLARPPTQSPPAVPPYPGPTGERAQWWWYDPFEPPPPANN